jgi:hypothetical protein
VAGMGEESRGDCGKRGCFMRERKGSLSHDRTTVL